MKTQKVIFKVYPSFFCRSVSLVGQLVDNAFQPVITKLIITQQTTLQDLSLFLRIRQEHMSLVKPQIVDTK